MAEGAAMRYFAKLVQDGIVAGSAVGLEPVERNPQGDDRAMNMTTSLAQDRTNHAGHVVTATIHPIRGIEGRTRTHGDPAIGMTMVPIMSTLVDHAFHLLLEYSGEFRITSCRNNAT
ncbi:MAG: hypothetical protein TREMPRED_000514 [Tremellales sp. Tagirdzhanova-0007]|nr:MAG: hypothetical protein TREMPRED_000514 [Tremellales sp. Tagirdzhanova-0007]